MRTVLDEDGQSAPAVEKTAAELQRERLDAALSKLPQNIKAKDQATFEELLAIPEPFEKRGQKFFIRFLSMRKLVLLGNAFQDFAACAGTLGDERAIEMLGAIGGQFLCKQEKDWALRAATNEEITDTFSLKEFLALASDYLTKNGWVGAATGEESGPNG